MIMCGGQPVSVATTERAQRGVPGDRLHPGLRPHRGRRRRSPSCRPQDARAQARLGGQAVASTSRSGWSTRRAPRCPPGDDGEILVRAPSVTAGYWDDPETDRAADRRRLAAHRRHGPLRRGRLPLHLRPQGRHDHQRRDEHLPGRDRGRAARARRRSPTSPSSACRTRSGARSSAPWSSRCRAPSIDERRADRLLHGAARRLQEADLGAGRRRDPAHGRREAEEVPAARALRRVAAAAPWPADCRIGQLRVRRANESMRQGVEPTRTARGER